MFLLGEAVADFKIDDLKKERFVCRNIVPFVMLYLLWAHGPSSGLLAQPSLDFSLVNERASYGPVLLDETRAYCYWPKTVVEEPSVTAIELSTGRLLWTKPAKLALPLNFRLEEGWLHYETVEGEQASFRRSSGPRTFHLVNTSTGEERVVPPAVEFRSTVDRPWVHDGYCLTPQGYLIRCEDGKKIGELGPGEHQTMPGDGFLVATTLVPDASNTRFEKRLLRKFRFDSMTVERQIELPLETAWRILAVKQNSVVGRIEVSSRDPYLTFVDLDQSQERWRVPIPKSMFMAVSHWENESRLILNIGIQGLARPLYVDLQTGEVIPDFSWQDPRLLMAWHQEASLYPDAVVSNDRFLIGRWRYLQLSCVDSQTGKLIWNQGSSDYLIGRIFGGDSELGEYLVAEARNGFEIISVKNGDRTRVTIEQVGLKPIPIQSAEGADADSPADAADLLFRNSDNDWLWDKGLLMGPFIPLAGWFLWSVIRR